MAAAVRVRRASSVSQPEDSAGLAGSISPRALSYSPVQHDTRTSHFTLLMHYLRQRRW